METTVVNRKKDGSSDVSDEMPSEAKLRRDIRHFERQIARLASPASTWEQGALKCYQVLVQQRRELLDNMRNGELSRI